MIFYFLSGIQRAAIKKMDAKATEEFLAELVLTHVHHLNLVGDLLIFSKIGHI